MDVLVVTEPSPLVLCETESVAAPLGRLGATGFEAWVGIVGQGVKAVPLSIPYERMAVSAIVSARSQLLIYGSVLPWRSAPIHASDLALPGETAGAMFERVLGEQVHDILALRRLYPDAIPFWAGDFNQSLEGPNVTGSRRGRQLLESALNSVAMDAWNRSAAHASPGASAIDLICGPDHLTVKGVETFGPTIDGRRLSDHAGYVIDLDDP